MQLNTEDARAAVLRARAAVLEATIEMMVAENDERSRQGLAPAHGPEQFQQAIDNSGCHPNAVVTLMIEGNL